MFRTLSLFWKLTDDHLHTFPPVPPLTHYILSDSQLGGLGHGNSPDETTKFNLKVQLQRKKKTTVFWEMLSPFRSRRLIIRKHISRLKRDINILR